MDNRIVQNVRRNGRMKLLVIGKTGTGKSSLCNVIAGEESDHDIFPVSAGAEGCTNVTQFANINFNGNEKRPISLIDTVGLDEQSVEDNADVVAELVEKLRNACDFVNLVAVLVNGNDQRFDASTSNMLKTFESMFGEELWPRTVFVFTKLSMDKKVKERRESKSMQTDDERAKKYLEKVESVFDGAKDLKHIFVDAHFDEENEEEREKFETSFESLYMSMVTGDLKGLPTSNVESVESLSQSMRNKIAEKEQGQVEETIQKILGYKHEVEEKKADARKSLLEIADYLDHVNRNSTKVKASGSGVGTVGGILSLTGVALSATGVGAAAGLPLIAAGNLFHRNLFQLLSFLLTGAAMGVVGAGASAGGAIGKYMKTKDGKKKGDAELEEYKETAEKNGSIIQAIMACLPSQIIEQMFKCESIPEEERAWLKNMMKNFLAAENILKEETKVPGQEMVISSELWTKEGYHVAKDGKELVDIIVEASTTTCAESATAGADVAVAVASAGFGASVGSVFLIWDTYNMVVSIDDLVKERPSSAGEFLRKQADNLYPTCALCDRHTFYNVPKFSNDCPPEICNCFTLEDPEVVKWLSMTKSHPHYAATCEEARKVVRQKLALDCNQKDCNQKTATEMGMRSHVLWLHGREKTDEKEQLVEANGHNLVVRIYGKLTYCQECKKLLWDKHNQANVLILNLINFPQGLHCSSCSLDFHEDCIRMLKDCCSGAVAPEKRALGRSHQLAERTFKTVTKCDFCSRTLWGVWKQV